MQSNTAARLCSEDLQAIRSELDLYKVGFIGAELLAVLRAAAMGDHRCLNRLFLAQSPPRSADASTLRCPSWHGKQSAGLCFLREKALYNLACTIWRARPPEVQRPKLAMPCEQTTQ